MENGWTVIWFSWRIWKSRIRMCQNIQLKSVHSFRKRLVILMKTWKLLFWQWQRTVPKEPQRWEWMHRFPCFRRNVSHCSDILNSCLHRLQTHRSMQSVRKSWLLQLFMSEQTVIFWSRRKRTVRCSESITRSWQIQIFWKLKIWKWMDSKLQRFQSLIIKTQVLRRR